MGKTRNQEESVKQNGSVKAKGNKEEESIRHRLYRNVKNTERRYLKYRAVELDGQLDDLVMEIAELGGINDQSKALAFKRTFVPDENWVDPEKTPRNNVKRSKEEQKKAKNKKDRIYRRNQRKLVRNLRKYVKEAEAVLQYLTSILDNLKRKAENKNEEPQEEIYQSVEKTDQRENETDLFEDKTDPFEDKTDQFEDETDQFEYKIETSMDGTDQVDCEDDQTEHETDGFQDETYPIDAEMTDDTSMMQIEFGNESEDTTEAQLLTSVVDGELLSIEDMFFE